MKEFNVSNGEGQLIIHLFGDNSKYEVNYDHGQITFNSQDFKYIVPDGIGYTATFFAPDPNTGKRKYLMGNIRDLYRDTTPTDFGLTNLSDVEIGSSHFTEEIIVGGINESTPVVAPAGVIIYVNGNPVASGTTVEEGDVVKFELTASQDFETASNYNLSVGDITKTVSITTKIGVLASCLAWKNAGYSTSGVYTINPASTSQRDVYCDMTTNGGGWTQVNSSFISSSNGTVSNNGGNTTTFSIRATQTNGSSVHYGAHYGFEIPGGFTTAVFKQTAGNVNYSCAGVTWNSRFHIGGTDLTADLSNYHYPGWSSVNSTEAFTTTANNTNYTSTVGSGNKIHVGLGGYSGCTRATHSFTLFYR